MGKTYWRVTVDSWGASTYDSEQQAMQEAEKWIKKYPEDDVWVDKIEPIYKYKGNHEI